MSQLESSTSTPSVFNDSSDRGSKTGLFVDAHAHFHSSFEEELFLTHAAQNIDQVAASYGCTNPLGVLLVADSGKQDTLDHLRGATASALGAWTLTETLEPISLRATDPSGKSLYLIAGRQLATIEGLEVLALACELGSIKPTTLVETLAVARSANAVSVVPWGFGKWWWTRGDVLRSVIDQEDSRRFFIGATSKLPALFDLPLLMQQSARAGFRNLQGSDPFPFAREMRRVGAFGSLLEGSLDAEQPAASLRRLLWETDCPPRPFGQGTSIPAFFRDQIAIRLWKTRRRASD
jgi:hypothetical protein